MGFPQSSHRYSAASGVAAVVLIVVSILLFGLDIPTYDDSGKVFAAYYADHSSNIELSVLIGAFAVIALIWFVGFMRWVYWGAETAARGFVRATDIGYSAAIAGITLATVTIITQEAAVVASGTVEPGVIRALDLLGDYSFVIARVFLSIWLLTSFFVIRVTKILPPWTSVLAVGGTVLGVVQSVLLLAPQNDDGPLGLLGYGFDVVLLVWVFVTSLTLVRRVDGIQRGS